MVFHVSYIIFFFFAGWFLLKSVYCFGNSFWSGILHYHIPKPSALLWSLGFKVWRRKKKQRNSCFSGCHSSGISQLSGHKGDLARVKLLPCKRQKQYQEGMDRPAYSVSIPWCFTVHLFVPLGWFLQPQFEYCLFPSLLLVQQQSCSIQHWVLPPPLLALLLSFLPTFPPLTFLVLFYLSYLVYFQIPCHFNAVYGTVSVLLSSGLSVWRLDSTAEWVFCVCGHEKLTQ